MLLKMGNQLMAHLKESGNSRLNMCTMELYALYISIVHMYTL